jgi:hypothetical protein
MATELMELEMTAEEYAKSIDAGWEAYINHEHGQAPGNRPYCYASSYEVCDRKMVLQMTQGDKVIPFPTEVLAKFHRGQDRERNMIVDLTRVGQFADPKFSVVGQQERFELRDHKGRVAIVGKVDLRLDYGHGRPSIPVECKDWHSTLTDRITCFEDLFDNPWTRKGGYQLLCYLYGAEEERGLLLLPRPGLPKLIPVELYASLGRVEEFLQKAELALDHKETGTLPNYILDAGECKRCPFYGKACNPPLLSGEGAQVITDPEVELMLERREELGEAAKEYGKIDSVIKKRFYGIETGIAGKFLLQGAKGKKTYYEYPKEIQDKYRKTDPEGRFTLTITKV